MQLATFLDFDASRPALVAPNKRALFHAVGQIAAQRLQVDVTELVGALLDRAIEKGIFGTKMRSVIKLASPSGIASVVDQQFDEARRILAKGLVPIIEPEVSIKSPERDAADRILLRELLEHLDQLPGEEQVMLKLTIPAEAGLFQPLGLRLTCTPP